VCGTPLKPAERKKKWASTRERADAIDKDMQICAARKRNLVDKQTACANGIVSLNRILEDLNSQAYEKKRDAERLASSIEELVAHIEQLADHTENPHTVALENNRARRKALQGDLRGKQAIIGDLAEAHKQAQFWQDGFKRIRLWLTKRVLGVLELETAAAAGTLGLVDWRIGYSTELELKGGSLKPGIHVQVRSPQAPGAWTDQSGGEEQRVRLAVSIGFASVVQRMSGTLHALEVWDEPSNWLSEQGVEDLLNCLSYRARTAHKTAWVVDHRSLASGAFQECWSVIKDAGGSRIIVLQAEE
jgi:DNA repair exonuclease SbcCD ATPase subunit